MQRRRHVHAERHLFEPGGRRCVRQLLYLVLRVTEMRKHQLTQAYVHAYAMCDSADVIGDTAAAEEGSSVHALPMELVHPVRTEGGREGSRRRPPALAQRLSHATASPRRLSPLLRVLSRRRAR